ncbi:putative secreted RxLR effector protein [Phytophthora cinnamomi]|uniref:putative secreted RxLR effector protein n=1 Tax=Phytophthora cinnamomi TaxID=4785 RepID=UPI00355945AC|nr:putative secreted RxLR effector protein [Phytophthora cinnamomi]
MRVHYIALAAAIFVASAGATSTLTASSPIVARGLTDLDASSTKRHLRTHTRTDAEEGEERGILGITLFDDIANGVMKKINDISDNLHVTNLLNGLNRENTHPNKAFNALEVGKVEGNLLASREFQLLERYVKMKNPEDPEEAIVAAITANLGGDVFSQKMAEAMKNPNTKELATSLEAAQLRRWLEHDFPPLDVLKTQKLDKATDALFDSPQFATWSNYLAAYNEKHPTKKMTQLDAFTETYGENGIVKLLGALDDGPGATKFKDEVATSLANPEHLAIVKLFGTLDDGTKYKNEMVTSWLADPDHPINMFEHLTLDKAGDDLFTSPFLDIWARYWEVFNDEYPFYKSTMLQTFKKFYGEEKSETMIKEAIKNPETKQLATFIRTAMKNPEAKRLPKKLQNPPSFKDWMSLKSSPSFKHWTS